MSPHENNLLNLIISSLFWLKKGRNVLTNGTLIMNRIHDIYEPIFHKYVHFAANIHRSTFKRSQKGLRIILSNWARISWGLERKKERRHNSFLNLKICTQQEKCWFHYIAAPVHKKTLYGQIKPLWQILNQF